MLRRRQTTHRGAYPVPAVRSIHDIAGIDDIDAGNALRKIRPQRQSFLNPQSLPRR